MGKENARATRLAALVTEVSLRALAGEKSFARGKAYFAAGAVASLVDSGETVKACVSGTDEYSVTLRASGKMLDWDCSCPLGDERAFCKHAVATGLAWIASGKHGATGAGYTGRSEFDAIRARLTRLDREALVELLMQQVEEDEPLRSRLRAQAVRTSADPKALKDAIRKALHAADFVDYRGMRALVQRAASVEDLLQGLLDDGRAALAADTAEYALERGLAAYERVDDSAGSFGDLLGRIARLHLDACRTARQDNATFGRKLFALKLRDQWGFFGWKDYAPLLGDAGRAAYRAAAEKEWAKVPARAPGNDGGRFDTEHFQITSIMEEIAREADDIDALVAVKSRDLASPYSFLQIAEILVEAGRRDGALAWVERGRAAFPHDVDARLVEFLVNEYGARQRFDDAARIAWEVFADHPDRRSFALLKRAAKHTKDPTVWREKAFARAREETAGKAAKGPVWRSVGHTLLIDLHLQDGDSDAALALAKQHGCPERLWKEIARAQEEKQPAIAAGIYRSVVDRIVNVANNRAYDNAVELILHVRELMHRADEASALDAWVEELRAKHKAKRNFIKRLDDGLGRRA